MSKLTIKVTPDKVQEAAVREALEENEGYCPCRISRSEETKCMCKEFREQQTPGPCHCGLYIKVEAE